MKRFNKWYTKLLLSIVFVFVFSLVLKNFFKIDFALVKENQKTVKATTISDDAFVILEIVPNIKYAEIGYLVGGQEPIDVAAAVAAGDFDINVFGDLQYPLFTEVVEYKTIKEEGCLPEMDWHVFPSGYYEKVEDNTGNFVLDVYNSDEAGLVVSAGFVFSEGKGNYNWVEAENVDSIPTNYNEEKVWLENQGMDVYVKKTFTNTEHFKSICLGNLNKEVVVKTVTPVELTSADIERADLVYFSASQHLGGATQLWDKYGKNKNYSSKQSSFAANDLSWEETLAIFERVIGQRGDRLPIILDAVMASNAGSRWTKNTEKLYFMLKKMNPQVFYNLYLNDNTSGGGVKENTILNVYNGQWGNNITWKEEDFQQDAKLLALYGIVSKDHNISLQTGGRSNVSVMGNVYTFNGNNSLPQLFPNIVSNSSVRKSEYTGEFFRYIIEKGEDVNAEKNSTSPAIAVKYIIGYNPGSTVNDKDTITVLDLEPCNDFTKTIRDFRLMMPTFTGSIKIVQQTSAEFNGKIEDLNKAYDMIYLGLNYGNNSFTLRSGLPSYNDTNLNGKIYLHVGDVVKGSTNNHIDSFPVNWLKNQSTNNRARLSGNDITKLKMEDLNDFIDAGYPVVADNYLYTSDRTRIDSTSYISKFVRRPDVGNILKESILNTTSETMLSQFLAVVKPRINMISSPREYSGNESEVLGDADSLYINGTNPNYTRLDFKFEIIDNAVASTETYRIELYVDVNADGNFSAKELISDAGNKRAGTHSYGLSLGEKYIGSIPWKLAIVNEKNASIRSEVIGMSAIRKSNAEKETISILQINSPYTGSGGNTSTVNLQKDIERQGKFYEFTKDINDFNIQFTTVTTSDFEKWFDVNPFRLNDKLNTDQLTQKYDMMIFGFSDMYPNISNAKGAVNNIEYFINMGNSVLFTHDVTSFNNKNYSGSNTQFGYSFNTLFRGYLSMDRFGARIATGEDLYSTVARDKATIANGGGKTYSEIHGYTTWALRRIGSLVSGNSVPLYPGFGFNTTPSANLLTKRVSKLNSGQVTMYPYHIDDSFQCAPTHPQYFELDLEDPSVVVWYCLDDDGTSDGKFYGKSPNDARNNYYIYNTGNITYTGVGHSSIENDMEVKLFVNTMIAAYNARQSPPTAEITNNDAIDTRDGYYIYVDNDYMDKDFTDADIMEITFKPDVNSLLSRYMGCQVILPDGTTTATIYDENNNVVTEEYIPKESTEPNSIKVTSGKTYKIKYSLKGLNNKAAQKMMIVLENEQGMKGITDVVLLRRSLFDLD